jgi:hypothetical protein
MVSMMSFDWPQHKKIACVIFARTLDLIECHETNASQQRIDDLMNIIAYLKDSLQTSATVKYPPLATTENKI